MSVAYKRGGGAEEFEEWKDYHHWSVQPVRRHLFRQFIAGTLGCLLLASAVILYGVSTRPTSSATADVLRMGLTEIERGFTSLRDELHALRTERGGVMGKLEELEIRLQNEVEGLRNEIAAARQERIEAMELLKAIVALDSNFPPMPSVKPTDYSGGETSN